MAETTRQRCTVTGCNPRLADQSEADAHRGQTGHRTAAWPVRSAEGVRRAKHRNRTGYYNKYNRAAEERALDELIEEGRIGAIDAMTPETRERSAAADRAAVRALQAAHRRYAHGPEEIEDPEDDHPFSSEALGQWL